MLRAKLVLAINSNHELAICPRDHIRTNNGRKRLSAPAEDNKEETIELLREYGRRVYQNYKTGGERHCFMPSIIPLHKEMKELGCDQAACVPSPNRGPKKKQRSGRRR